MFCIWPTMALAVYASLNPTQHNMHLFIAASFFCSVQWDSIASSAKHLSDCWYLCSVGSLRHIAGYWKIDVHA